MPPLKDILGPTLIQNAFGRMQKWDVKKTDEILAGKKVGLLFASSWCAADCNTNVHANTHTACGERRANVAYSMTRCPYPYRDQASKDLVSTLKDIYRLLREDQKSFEIILCSTETNDENFTRFFGAFCCVRGAEQVPRAKYPSPDVWRFRTGSRATMAGPSIRREPEGEGGAADPALHGTWSPDNCLSP